MRKGRREVTRQQERDRKQGRRPLLLERLLPLSVGLGVGWGNAPAWKLDVAANSSIHQRWPLRRLGQEFPQCLSRSATLPRLDMHQVRG